MKYAEFNQYLLSFLRLYACNVYIYLEFFYYLTTDLSQSELSNNVQ